MANKQNKTTKTRTRKNSARQKNRMKQEHYEKAQYEHENARLASMLLSLREAAVVAETGKAKSWHVMPQAAEFARGVKTPTPFDCTNLLKVNLPSGRGRFGRNSTRFGGNWGPANA